MIFIILAILITISLVNRIPEKIRYIFMTSILLLIILIGFGVGTDYFSYQYLYDTFNPLRSDNLELGFKAIYYLSKSNNIPFHTVAFFLRAIITAGISYWIYQSSENKFVSLIIYYCMFFFIWSMSAIRQGLVLAIGSYLFVNKEKEISLFKEIIIVMLLSTIHLSGLFYFVILGLNRINWTKKKQIIILCITLALTLIPMAKIFEHFTFIPGISSVMYYVSNSIGFFDFPSLMRLFFFTFIILFYDKLNTDIYSKKITDTFLNGISIYFALKFSEITAARLTIYSFILIVLLLPKIINIVSTEYKQKIRYVSRISSIILFMIVTIFLTKDFISYKEQVAYVGSINSFDFMTIWNKDSSQFDTFFAAYDHNKTKNANYVLEFKEKSKDIPVEKILKGEELIVLIDRATGKYGVMNSKGNWVVAPEYDQAPQLFGHILITKSKNTLFEEETKIDLYGEMNSEEIDIYISNLLKSNYLNSNVVEKETSLKFIDVIENPMDYVPSLNHIENDKVYRIETDGLVYHILYYTYYGSGNFIYLDEELKPMSDIVHNKQALYDNKFLIATALGGTAVYNKDGDLIWFY